VAQANTVLPLPISSSPALAVDNVHQRVFLADSNVGYCLNSGTLAFHDFTGERLTTITTNQAHVSGPAVSADGSKAAVADASAGTRLLNTADLSDAATGYRPLPDGATAISVAFSGDGKYLARGAAPTGATPDLLVQRRRPGGLDGPAGVRLRGQPRQRQGRSARHGVVGGRLPAVASTVRRPRWWSPRDPQPCAASWSRTARRPPSP
jgi:hypothetical protein